MIYTCIKDFPNTEITVGTDLEIIKLDDGEYVIDGAIKTNGDIVYEFFKKKQLDGFKYSPYSFSRIESWASCPKKFEFQYIVKPPREDVANPILEKGTLFHAVLEHAIVNKLEDFSIDEELKALSDVEIEEIVTNALNFTIKSNIYKRIRKLKGVKIPEKEMLLCSDLKPTTDQSKALIRGFIDLLVIDEENKICYIFDWKTGGKSKENLEKWPKPKDQLELYAIWANQMYDVDQIETAFVYVEHDHTANYSFKNKDIEHLKKKFKEKIDVIEKDTKFEKNLSQLCAWCDYRTLCLGLDPSKQPRDISKEEIFNAGKAKKESKPSEKNSAFLNKLRSRGSS